MAAGSYGGKKFGGNKFGGAKIGGNTFGGNKFGASADLDLSKPKAKTASYTPGPAPAVRGAGKVSGGSLLETASAAGRSVKKPGAPLSAVSRTQQRRGSAKAAPGFGASSGSITKSSPDAAKARKKAGDDYLTDYGVGSAVNSFVNKKKR